MSRYNDRTVQDLKLDVAEFQASDCDDLLDWLGRRAAVRNGGYAG